MKMSCFKFHENQPVNEQFVFFRGGGKGEGPPGVIGPLFLNFYLSYYCKYIKMLCFKCHESQPVNEEFVSLGGGGRGTRG